MGYPPDEHPFNPHLTLGRIKSIQNKDNLKNIMRIFPTELIQTVRVNKFVLYESILQKTGPIYKPVEEYKLN